MARVLLALPLLVAAFGTSGRPAEAGVCKRHIELGSPSVAYTAYVRTHATAYRAPWRDPFARFRSHNANGYPTLFSVHGAVLEGACTPSWYRVQLPLRPNGVTGYVRADQVRLAKIRTRIVVDLSARHLTLFRGGRAVRRALVGIGSPATPTPTGRFYVNQRLIPADKNGPWGPAALGVSAFSPTLHSWTPLTAASVSGTR
jgi:L,D-transpeptidase catalytic domain